MRKIRTETDEFLSATVASPRMDEVTSKQKSYKSFLHEEIIMPSVPVDTNPPDENKIQSLSRSNPVQLWDEEYRRFCLIKQERKLKKVKIIEHPPPSTKCQAWMETDTTQDSKVNVEGSKVKRFRTKRLHKVAKPQQDEIELGVEMIKPPKGQGQRKEKKVKIIDDHFPCPSTVIYAWNETSDEPVVQKQAILVQKALNMTTSTKLAASSASVIRPWKDEVTSGFTFEVILPNVPMDTTPCDVPVFQREQEKREKDEVKKTLKVSTPPSTKGQGVRMLDPCILKTVWEPEEPLEMKNFCTMIELKAYERKQHIKMARKEQERQRIIELGEQVDNVSLKKRLSKKCSKLFNKTFLHQSSAEVPIHPHLSQAQSHLLYI